MPYYKSPDNSLHFLDSVEFEYLLPQGSIQITDEEYATLSAPPEPTQAQLVLAQIATLEASVTDRRIREAVLGIDNGWLKSLNDNVATLRASLSPVNPVDIGTATAQVSV